MAIYKTMDITRVLSANTGKEFTPFDHKSEAAWVVPVAILFRFNFCLAVFINHGGVQKIMGFFINVD